MSSIPLHIERTFERRWAARFSSPPLPGKHRLERPYQELASPPEERAQRRRRQTKGPSEFRDRVDLPKAKGK
jgi:hypothetical protein